MLHHLAWSILGLPFLRHRRFALDDNSTNLLWVALPSSARAGTTTTTRSRARPHGLRWWELDPSELVDPPHAPRRPRVGRRARSLPPVNSRSSPRPSQLDPVLQRAAPCMERCRPHTGIVRSLVRRRGRGDSRARIERTPDQAPAGTRPARRRSLARRVSYRLGATRRERRACRVRRRPSSGPTRRPCGASGRSPRSRPARSRGRRRPAGRAPRATGTRPARCPRP